MSVAAAASGLMAVGKSSPSDGKSMSSGICDTAAGDLVSRIFSAGDGMLSSPTAVRFNGLVLVLVV